MRDLVDKKERERRNQQVKKKAQDYKIVVEIHGIIINVHHVTHDFQSFLQSLHFAFN